ncbi:hypothetical protein ON010_g17014 [Phytophthora cinnamomi]|nr:hypothetical protein ON010_g17014 [Phytophthora cinnamomi]
MVLEDTQSRKELQVELTNFPLHRVDVSPVYRASASRPTEDSAKAVINRLSFDDSDSDRTQYLEVRTHASLDKIVEFEGKRYRSEDSLQWLKRFIYEMKGTGMAQDAWCEPFSLSLGPAAKGWYRQLLKKTQRKWNLLGEAFLDYYCSQFDQSARTGYYSARRKENGPVCNFLIRLNGYAKSAKIQYESKGPDAADHVEHFLLNCGDDDIMDLLYPQQLDDVKKVEKIINQEILGKSGRSSRTGSWEHTVEMGSGLSRLGGVTSAETTGVTNAETIDAEIAETTDVEIAEMIGEIIAETTGDRVEMMAGTAAYQQLRYGTMIHSYHSYSVSADDSEEDYLDAGNVSDRGRRSSDRNSSAKTPRGDVRRVPPGATERTGRPAERRDYDGRRDSRGRPPYGLCASCGGANHSVHFCRRRCKFCKQIHDAGQCELFQRYEKLASFVKANVDKSKVPDDLQDLYTPSDLNAAARQH